MPQAVLLNPNPIKILNNHTTTTTGFALNAYQAIELNDLGLHIGGTEEILNYKMFQDTLQVPSIIFAQKTENDDINVNDNRKIAEINLNCSELHDATNDTFRCNFSFKQYRRGNNEKENNGYYEIYNLPESKYTISNGHYQYSSVDEYTILTNNDVDNHQLLTTQQKIANGVTFTAHKIGNWCWLVARGTLVSDVANTYVFWTLPAGYRPLNTIRVISKNQSVDKCDRMRINATGDVRMENASSSGQQQHFGIMYYTADPSAT